VGHVVFLFLHFIAAVFIAPVLLFVTIPAHLIYGAVSYNKPASKPTPDTHVRCPDCRELVLKDANVCKYCGCKLIPQA
jgi:hypothetical protein